MKTIQRIAVDLDDVVAEYVPTLTNYYNRVYNDAVQVGDITTWKLKDHYEQTSTSEEVKALMTLFAHSKEFREMPPVPGAVEALKHLRNHYDVSIVTARASRSIDATYDWMREQGISDIPVYFNKEKGKMCWNLGVDLIIDDGVHNLDDVMNYTRQASQGSLFPPTNTLLYDRPWNRGHVNAQSHERARDWREVLKIINSYE